MADFSGSNGADVESPSIGGKPKRFSLNSLHPNIAEALKEFDFDGNGKVTVGEVQRGAELLKETKKKHKRAVWALIVQFVVYAALTAASCGVLYHFLFLMKDTAVDPSTGTLMVKSDDSSAEDVEVSVKAHGTAFASNSKAVDSETGLEKECIDGATAVAMFVQATEGTPTRYVSEDPSTAALTVFPIGSEEASWTNETIDFGRLVFVPDPDCTSMYSGEDGSNNDGTRSLLSDENMYIDHDALRKLAISSIVGDASGNEQRRQLRNDWARWNPPGLPKMGSSGLSGRGYSKLG
jgi:hypothetical protein